MNGTALINCMNVISEIDWRLLRQQWVHLSDVEEQWDDGKTSFILDDVQMESVIGWLHLVFLLVQAAGLDMRDPAIWDDPDDNLETKEDE